MFLETIDIVQRQFCAYTPQHNRVVERMNRAVLSSARALIDQKCFPKNFWAEAMATAAHNCNRTTCAIVPANNTSFEVWTGRKPDLGLLRVFGSPCRYHMREELSKSLGNRGSSTALLGNESRQKTYKLLDDENRKVFDSRNDLLNEKGIIFISNNTTVLPLSF